MYQSKIAGLGKYVPENVVNNEDLSKIMDTNDSWIQERTGIKERRHIKKGDGNTTASMGAKAANIALERANISKDDIDLIVFATLSPDYYFPGCGVQIQEILDIHTCPALDVRNQCSGFIYGLSVADQFIKTGMYKNILLIGSENHSGGLDFTTRGRSVSVIFGDGAGAVVLTRSDHNGQGILSTHLHSEGKHALELSLKGPSTNHWVPEIIEENPQEDIPYYPYMNGQFVFKNAVVRFSEVIMEGLKANGLDVKDIDMLIPHQANLRISQFIQQKFKLRDDQVYNNIQRYGNTTAASIPIALTEAWEEGKIKEGDTIVLAAFGSGFTWASAVIEW
ncbi:3-oxoacyl-ACP synthase III family protein [Zunongwangia profunda]|uniref:Beta-ketoacyl-[acyl-carrier-protein] synthase III n=2 Tax=Zunongwangia profunda TaxID=398743 RepID=D5BIT2_ZUNPS|nr:beta-ketoacyl-ACP synthase III [Zunongwangia profunda]ADF51534.1 3-oxoacyl-[acyl-carrier-protein] synthase III [Zunongwangia profunda SM-A87]MAS69168.1 ketoacyl-ACP synthase III [Zunongwangia sp.]HCV80949.1 ketoacyl-ACP synthase III [Zunongwangia profunda]|tara:strand:- start:73 stop:1080 length:1008 start_codon:yes stop_codon:yes gene_type:complete